MHFNSAIWNNALWSIRSRPGQDRRPSPATTPPLAPAFDRVVYGALTTRLGPTAGFLDARAAVEQVIIDAGLDPVVLRVAREVFDQNKICAGCPDTGELAGDRGLSAPSTQLHPVVSRRQRRPGSTSAAGRPGIGFAATTKLGGAGRLLAATSDVAEVAFGGDALVTFDLNGAIKRGAPLRRSGSPTILARAGFASRPGGRAGRLRRRRGLGRQRRGRPRFVDPAGAVTMPTCRAWAATPSPARAPAAATSRSAPTAAGSCSGSRVASFTQVGELDGAVSRGGARRQPGGRRSTGVDRDRSSPPGGPASSSAARRRRSASR